MTWCRPRGCARRGTPNRARACDCGCRRAGAPSRRTRARRMAPSRSQHAHRRFDRPTGWIAVGRIGRAARAGRERAAGGGRPRSTSACAGSTCWRCCAGRCRCCARSRAALPERLLVVGAGDPMWRGGLSGPNSVFVHASLPLISRDGTSPLLHELMHAMLGISPGPGGDWIVEGLAETYSLELLVRSRTLSKKRYEKALAQLAARGRQAPMLEVERSSGATTARAVTVLHALDRVIRDGSGRRAQPRRRRPHPLSAGRRGDEPSGCGGSPRTSRAATSAPSSGASWASVGGRMTTIYPYSASDLPIGEWDTPDVPARGGAARPHRRAHAPRLERVGAPAHAAARAHRLVPVPPRRLQDGRDAWSATACSTCSRWGRPREASATTAT